MPRCDCLDLVDPLLRDKSPSVRERLEPAFQFNVREEFAQLFKNDAAGTPIADRS
jgi:hypothetical protein